MSVIVINLNCGEMVEISQSLFRIFIFKSLGMKKIIYNKKAILKIKLVIHESTS